MKASAILTDGQFSALMRAVASHHSDGAMRDAFLFHFLARTGLRISEALSVQVHHLSLDADPPFVAVRTLKQRRTDGKRPLDHVYLDRETAQRAGAYVRRVLPRLLEEPNRDAPAWEFLFVARHAKRRGLVEGSTRLSPISRRNAAQVLRTWARRAGLPATVTLKSFRHYRSTTLLRRTGDLEFTRSQLRHRSVSSTQVYLHVDPDLIKRQLEKAARVDR